MEEVVISVIVPVYNTLKYLPRCVQSIRNQTYQKLDIILVDDGSNDGTGKLCDELAVEDSRIRVFHKENGGSSSARNLGIKEAVGEYIGFIDSDDYIEEHMYQYLLAGIQKYDLEMAQVGRDEINEDGTKRADICAVPDKEEIVESKDFMKELLLHRGDCSFCTKLIKRELFAELQFPIGELNEDFKLLIQHLTSMKGVVNLPYIGYHVCYRLGSNTRKENKENFSRVFLDCVHNSDYAYEVVEKHFVELKKIVQRFQIFQRIEYMLHIPISQMNRENKEYVAIHKFLKEQCVKALGNSYLTNKNKCYLILFVVAPCTVRKIHAKLRLRKH